MKHRNKLLALAALSIAAVYPAAPALASSALDSVNVSTEADLSTFTKIYIAPVEVELKDRFRRNLRDVGAPRPVSERDQAKKAEDSHEYFVRAFSKKYEVVDEPGEGILTVEPIITRLESTRPTSADYEEVPSLSPFSIYAGGADYRVRLKTGETLLTEISEKYRTDLFDGQPRNGIWTDFEFASRRMASKLIKHIKKN